MENHSEARKTSKTKRLMDTTTSVAGAGAIGLGWATSIAGRGLAVLKTARAVRVGTAMQGAGGVGVAVGVAILTVGIVANILLTDRDADEELAAPQAGSEPASQAA